MNISPDTIFEKTSFAIDAVERRQVIVTDNVFSRIESLNVEMLATRAPVVRVWVESKAKSAYSIIRTVNSKAKSIAGCLNIEISPLTNDDFAPIGTGA